jgi:hypothetical protein
VPAFFALAISNQDNWFGLLSRKSRRIDWLEVKVLAVEGTLASFLPDGHAVMTCALAEATNPHTVAITKLTVHFHCGFCLNILLLSVVPYGTSKSPYSVSHHLSFNPSLSPAYLLSTSSSAARTLIHIWIWLI